MKDTGDESRVYEAVDDKIVSAMWIAMRRAFGRGSALVVCIYYEMNVERIVQSANVDGVPNTSERSSCLNDVDSLTIVSTINLNKIEQFDKQLRISDKIEETSVEEVENSFPNICYGLIASQCPVELPELSPDLNSNDKEVVERLRHIGDKIDELFGSEIEDMLGLLPSTDSPLGIVKKIFFGLFKDKEFSWGRILAFINFGVKLCLHSIKNILPYKLKDLCVDIVKAIGCQLALGAFRWIANHGGWQRILSSNSWISNKEEISERFALPFFMPPCPIQLINPKRVRDRLAILLHQIEARDARRVDQSESWSLIIDRTHLCEALDEHGVLWTLFHCLFTYHFDMMCLDKDQSCLIAKTSGVVVSISSANTFYQTAVDSDL
nr:Bcl 2 ous antagonist:killer [Hymenolepis microstoma]